MMGRNVLTFIAKTLFFTAVSVGISTAILYTAYDEYIDKKIVNYVATWAPPPSTPSITSNPIPTSTESTITKTTTTTSNDIEKPFSVEISGLGIANGIVHNLYDNVVVVRKIPFAKPPIGDLRFNAPRIERDWSTYAHVDMDSSLAVLNGTGNSQQCFQSQDSSEDTKSSEDCLYLDIYIPKSAIENDTVKYPVYLYFHGGAFHIGNSTVIDGSYIAATQNIIVIAANYRLGVFGFWCHEDFEARMDLEHGLSFNDQLLYSGNQGLMDQQMAMIWTREYVLSIGGDPERITIGGMSAGAQSINAHAVMLSSAPLFDKMISISAPNGIPYYNDTEAQPIYEQIAGNLGCCRFQSTTWGSCNGGVVKECVMGKSSQEINLEAWKIRQFLSVDPQRITMIAEPFHPTWNTALLEKMPYYHIANGELIDKPFFVDTADNEGWGFIPKAFQGIGGNGNQVQEDRWERLLQFLFENDFETVIQFYKCPCPSCECWPVADEFLTDFTWYCNLRSALNQGYPKSSSRKHPIYNVRLSQPPPNTPDKVEHGSGEDWYFDTFGNESELIWRNDYQNYVSNFIRHGSPNNWDDNQNNIPTFEVIWTDWVSTQTFFDAGANGSLSFDEQVVDKREERCNMLDEIDHYMKH